MPPLVWLFPWLVVVACVALACALDWSLIVAWPVALLCPSTLSLSGALRFSWRVGALDLPSGGIGNFSLEMVSPGGRNKFLFWNY